MDFSRKLPYGSIPNSDKLCIEALSEFVVALQYFCTVTGVFTLFQSSLFEQSIEFFQAVEM